MRGARLLPPDPRPLFPALAPPCCPHGALGGGQVQVLRCHHDCLRGRQRAQPRDPGGRRRHTFSECKPATPLAGPGPLPGLAVTLGLEDVERLLGEENEPALNPADDDLAPATWAQAPAFGCRIQQRPAVWARRGRGASLRGRSRTRLVRHNDLRVGRRPAAGPRLNLRAGYWSIAPEEALQEPDAHLP